MAPSTGLNLCSPLPSIFGLMMSHLRLKEFQQNCMVFSRNVLRQCAQSPRVSQCKRNIFFVCIRFNSVNLEPRVHPSSCA